MYWRGLDGIIFGLDFKRGLLYFDYYFFNLLLRFLLSKCSSFNGYVNLGFMFREEIVIMNLLFEG